MSIGMGKPAARRLLDTVKKRKGTLKKKIIQTFINQSTSKELKSLEKVSENNQQNSNNLTCLIKESVSVITSYNSELPKHPTFESSIHIFQELKIGQQLGDGSYGIVHKGEWNRSDGVVIPVAVKVLKEDFIQQQAVYDDFVREVEAMHSLQHSCLIRYLSLVHCGRLKF